MNKLTIKINLEEKEYELTGDYNPNDTASIHDCINCVINKAEGFKADLKELNRISEAFGYQPRKVDRAYIIYSRQDGTIIDTITVNDVNDVIQMGNFVQNFFIV